MSINIYEFDIGFGDFDEKTTTYKGYYSDYGNKPFELNPFKKKINRIMIIIKHVMLVKKEN